MAFLRRFKGFLSFLKAFLRLFKGFLWTLVSWEPDRGRLCSRSCLPQLCWARGAHSQNSACAECFRGSAPPPWRERFGGFALLKYISWGLLLTPPSLKVFAVLEYICRFKVLFAPPDPPPSRAPFRGLCWQWWCWGRLWFHRDPERFL